MLRADIDQIHTIPVPRGWFIEDAWTEIVIFGRLPEHSRLNPRYWRPGWANVRVRANANPLTEFEIL